VRFSGVLFLLSTLSTVSYRVLPMKLRRDGSENDDVSRDKFFNRRNVQSEGWFQTIRFGQEK